MTTTVHHHAEAPGVTWDLTIDGHRYLVIEDGPGTDCGYTGSREYRYMLHGCRCDACRIGRTAAVRRRRLARKLVAGQAA